MKYKQKIREQETQQNQKYIKMVIEQDEKDIKNQKDADIRAKKKRLEVRNFQIMQFGQKSPNLKVGDCFSYTQNSPVHNTMTSDAASSVMNNSTFAKRSKVDGMSAEEIRLNRRLLEKISLFKRENIPQMGNYVE